MNITVLCTDPAHPVVPHLQAWVAQTRNQGHQTQLVHDRAELKGGDLLFLVSCAQVIRAAERDRFRATLVLHASDLPRGRGWSPHIWAVLGGAAEFTVSLLTAADPVDTGEIWLQQKCRLEGHELLPEIEAQLFAAELCLMTQSVERFDELRPTPQIGDPGPCLRRRTPDDSRLDPHKTIAEQFDLLRVVDACRFPAFFEHRGCRYLIKIEKAVV